jgi:hypothetical protein
LDALERTWLSQGKSLSRIRYLRYYYRNRERYLSKSKKSKNTSRTAPLDEFVEKVDIKPGLIF